MRSNRVRDVLPLAGTLLVVGYVLSLVLILTSCGQTPPVQTVAGLGTQVETDLTTILTTAQALQGQGVITRGQLDQLALVVDKAGREGQTLAQALTDYDALVAAKGDTTALVASIQGMITDITTALNGIGQTIIPTGTVATIDQAVATAVGLVLQIKAGVL